MGSHNKLTFCFATGNFANPEKKIEYASSKTTISCEFLSHSPVEMAHIQRRERAVEIAGRRNYDNINNNYQKLNTATPSVHPLESHSGSDSVSGKQPCHPWPERGIKVIPLLASDLGQATLSHHQLSVMPGSLQAL